LYKSYEKEIRRLAYKQIKKYPFFHILNRKQKKLVAQQILNDVVNNYNYDNEITPNLNELTNTPDIENTAGIMTIDQMKELIEHTNRNVFKLPVQNRDKFLKDPELIAIDKLLDNSIVNILLANDSYTPSERHIFPCQLLRAEILKAISYPEFSYRKFCDKQLNNMEQTANRTFACLHLNKKVFISHSQLSTFRSTLSFTQLCNLMVYVICQFMMSGRLGSPFQVLGIDSTDLAAKCCPRPLAKVKLPNGKNVRIYSEIDADCGKRRKKRDKSEFFVGYRLHTLVVINPLTGKACPLISLAAPPNHHDSLFTTQLMALAKAIGLKPDIILGDDAYGDSVDCEEVNQKYGFKLVCPAKPKVNTPENVDGDGKKVFINGYCETPMQYMGRTDSGHEYKCSALPDECFHFECCPKFREISLDSGFFGQIPEQVPLVDKLRGLRKHLERSFNLLKNREGLKEPRAKSQHGTLAMATFANMANLLIEIAGTRTTIKEENPQYTLELQDAA